MTGKGRTSRVLGVHLIGRGFGESIILELPDGEVGVIDCCSPLRLAKASRTERIRINPTLKFLHDALKAKKLAFLGFTHPHEDHGSGLSHLLEHFGDKIKQFWLFDVFFLLELGNYFRALSQVRTPSAVEELLNEQAGTFGEEMLNVARRVGAQVNSRRRSKPIIRLFGKLRSFVVSGVQVDCLGPHGNVASGYGQAIARNLKGVLDANGKLVREGWNPLKVNHNQISPALLLTFGKTKVVLGGDMEQAAWKAVLRDVKNRDEMMPNLRCHFWKVSHHGSKTGATNQLMRAFSPRKAMLAALTPFNRHQAPLPNSVGVGRIRPRVSQLLTTNLPEAQKALTGRNAPIGIPPDWISLLANNPSLQGALTQTVIGPERRVLPFPFVPNELKPALFADPSRLCLLRPNLQISARQEIEKMQGGVHNACRLSFYFDASGRELMNRRYVGALAGTLR